MAKFRTRARTVDMLGRQQIAGIPTAISELFKNAHDAYADRVEVDFFRKSGLFVMRDDGVGMSRDDFERRWLVLGTESKVDNAPGVGPLFADPTKAKRPVLGEKGIGRLAIAAIGSQVLVLTRAKKSDSTPTDLVAAFVHWGVFRLPGIDLEEIEIPIRTLSVGDFPSAALVREMIAEARGNLDTLTQGGGSEASSQIRKEMECFKIDPGDLDSKLGAPTLRGGGHGTHFFIYPADESLAAALDAPRGDDEAAPPLHKMLVGFTNTMTPRHAPPVIGTAFRDHKADDVVDDLIEEAEFFTPDEFQNADHHIDGTFDEFGQFEGTVTVFGEATPNYIVPWAARAQPTECGRFHLNLAVVQGVSSQSTVPNDDWARIIRKMNRIGGLYIYRDGIRVLPYGNNDYDFLDIERNRTKSAGYYYFSYRRIFGAIEIDRAHNGQLQEKAGREGFRENYAYRQFRDVLKNFFVQVAADFFREGSARLGGYEARRAELSRLDKARRARERHIGVRRTEFREKLTARSADIAEGRAGENVATILANLERDLKVAEVEPDADRSAQEFMKAEASGRDALASMRESFRLSAPRGVGLPQTLRREFDAYRQEYDHFARTQLEPAQHTIERMLTEATSRAEVSIDRRVRFDRALTEITAAARKNTQSESAEARSAADDVRQRVGDLARASIQEVEQTVGGVLSRAARLDVASLNDEAFVAQRSALENDVEKAAEETRGQLNSVVEQLRAITAHLQGNSGKLGETTPLDAEEALEEELIALRERSEADLELAQLGIAVQVINHEFDATIRSVRKDIRQLRAWADANDKMRKLYESIRDNFSHLDGYLTLFTPLQRRLYRAAVKMTGADILRFLEDLFAERLKRHNVELQGTPAFKKYALLGFPSTFYPVFVNLVDNAIYWVTKGLGPRIIRLDIAGPSLTVSDSGPGVDPRDREVIFEYGFTRKPGGRGLGLHISREVLRRGGFELSIGSGANELGGAQFEIRPVEQAADESLVDSNRSGG
jgi:signal transduction histidine kinase